MYVFGNKTPLTFSENQPSHKSHLNKTKKREKWMKMWFGGCQMAWRIWWLFDLSPHVIMRFWFHYVQCITFCATFFNVFLRCSHANTLPLPSSAPLEGFYMPLQRTKDFVMIHLLNFWISWKRFWRDSTPGCWLHISPLQINLSFLLYTISVSQCGITRKHMRDRISVGHQG